MTGSMGFELTEQIERHLIGDQLAWFTTVLAPETIAATSWSRSGPGNANSAMSSFQAAPQAACAQAYGC